MEAIIKESTSLYYEIDDCITNLIKARLDKDINKENKAIFCMESLLVSTMQHISWLVGEWKGSSNIKWHTGEPKDNGMYLATFIKTSEGDTSVVPLYRIRGNWETTSWDSVKPKRIKAWCKLSDIKPYKEDDK